MRLERYFAPFIVGELYIFRAFNREFYMISYSYLFCPLFGHVIYL